ncbi:cell division control protein 48 homolog C-like [Salvia hispanica]|uniref:cell division control protein 48 homolog C-like n=1 Tax=Salvia hispanica TaxID=49212 RepID=UPI00200955E9|nr:cell division control protein 48 homolog C-like [Salvia hispanica]
MTREKGSAAVALRRHIESVSNGKGNLTDEQIVNLLCSLHRLTYSRLDRNLLTERVAKITQLQRRRAGVFSQDPAPFSARRQKINEPAPFSAKRKKINEFSASPLEKGDCSNNPKTIGNLGRSDELGHGRGEMNRNGRRSESESESEKHSRPSFRDLLGITSVIDELKQEVVRPLHQLKLLRHLGVKPTSRILLHGPPKCGKTMLARAVANEARLPLFEISVARLMRGDLGAAEEKIRRLFLTAYMRAPSVVFIDEIDAMTSVKKRTLKEVEYRIVDQLMAFMDGRDRPTGPVNDDVSFESSNSTPGYVLVIGATNRPDALDTALRRLFDREFALGVPDECERFDILSALTRNLKVEVGFDPRKLARSTMGYVAGDLVALAKKAGMLAVHSIMGKRNTEYLKELRHMVEHGECYMQPFYDEELENLSITMNHFVQAGKMVQLSAIMKDFFTTLHAKWDDVGGLEALKSEFERHVVKAIKYPRVYELISELTMEGVLVFGATNRLEIVSHSSLIKTQFDRLLYVPLPTPEERGAILKALTRCKPIDPDVDLMALGNDVACENFSGRDLFTLVTEASKFAINRPALSVGNRMTIKYADFESALAEVSPSLSATVLLLEVKK